MLFNLYMDDSTLAFNCSGIEEYVIMPFFNHLRYADELFFMPYLFNIYQRLCK